MAERKIREVSKTKWFPTGASPGAAHIRVPERFAAINRMIIRDLNDKTSGRPIFGRYTKTKIMEFLRDPYTNEKKLRDAVIYLYGVSAHFRRLIQYFVSLNDLTYVVSPFHIDTKTANIQTVQRNFRKVMNLLASMDIKNSLERILTVCLREDVFFGTIREETDSIVIQQLPSDYCAISAIEDNVPNVTFNFSYFDIYPNLLEMYPAEFTSKYRLYTTARMKYQWQELDAPNSFAIKCNKEILNYAMPPFAGILREIYDLEDLSVQVACTGMCMKNISLNCWEVIRAYAATA